MYCACEPIVNARTLTSLGSSQHWKDAATQMSDNDSQNTDHAAWSARLQDLATLQLGLERLALVAQTGSALEKAISLVVSVIDAMKSAAMGIAWKAAVKIVPAIAGVYDAVIGIRHSMQQLSAPLAALRRFLPVTTESLRAEQASQARPPDLSGQLYAVASAMPEVSNGLRQLSGLTANTSRAIEGLSSAVSRLDTVPGVGSLAERLKDALAKLSISLGETQMTIQEVTAQLSKAQGWLPGYQAQTRKPIADVTLCQAEEKTGLFKKEQCRRPVSRFDDEASAHCSVCHISVCDQHRVAVPMPTGSTTRNTWLCLECARKQHK